MSIVFFLKILDCQMFIFETPNVEWKISSKTVITAVLPGNSRLSIFLFLMLPDCRLLSSRTSLIVKGFLWKIRNFASWTENVLEKRVNCLYQEIPGCINCSFCFKNCRLSIESPDCQHYSVKIPFARLIFQSNFHVVLQLLVKKLNPLVLGTHCTEAPWDHCYWGTCRYAWKANPTLCSTAGAHMCPRLPCIICSSRLQFSCSGDLLQLAVFTPSGHYTALLIR